MIYFTLRKHAREFARKRDSYHVVDCGPDAPPKKRWAVKVV